LVVKVIIAGSRFDMRNKPLVLRMKREVIKAIELSGFQISEVVSGMARGFDQLGEMYAKKFNLPVYAAPADWDTYGKSAGYRRNVEMAEHADALLAFWDGKSKGTKHMIDIAESKGLQIYVHNIEI
jgi:hypothetical protein